MFRKTKYVHDIYGKWSMRVKKHSQCIKNIQHVLKMLNVYQKKFKVY